jgi:hypothetical protein
MADGARLSEEGLVDPHVTGPVFWHENENVSVVEPVFRTWKIREPLPPVAMVVAEGGVMLIEGAITGTVTWP